MDSKITKKRLNEYISYEWIVMLAIAVACCFLWELFYGIASVKPTIGQEFKYYYDLGVWSDNSSSFHNFIKNEKALSYDVLEFDYEIISEEFETLGVRLSVAEGDMIFTDCKAVELSDGRTTVRANTIIDGWKVYTLDDLLKDAKDYLKTFLKEGAISGAELDYKAFDQNFDGQKIKAAFDQRLSNDNRFRSAEQKAQGVKLETERIKKLVKDVYDFSYFLENAPDNAFYRYTRYEESYLRYKDMDEHWDYYKDLYGPLYEEEYKVRPNARYAINLGALTGGKSNPSLYIKNSSSATADNVAMMAFDFKSEQPELQFECVSFMMTVVREFSNIIPA